MAGESVLIIDDNAINLKLARVLLSVEGYDVHTATDAEEALEALGRVRPRVILMDLQLPGMDGLELTQRLKSDPATRDIVILAITAYAMKGDEERALAAGCDGYIPKPIDTRALPGLVARHLANTVRLRPDSSSPRTGSGSPPQLLSRLNGMPRDSSGEA